MRHSISGEDPISRTGTCSVCGPIGIRLRKGRRPECMTVRRAQADSPRAKQTRRRARLRENRCNNLVGIIENNPGLAGKAHRYIAQYA